MPKIYSSRQCLRGQIEDNIQLPWTIDSEKYIPQGIEGYLALIYTDLGSTPDRATHY
ncbi:MAG: hypothetical protein QNJ54_31140 [Prochloraceae cyanobacterium]|nr:hypothetical protein [Prochloraceae cyanobacterium]